MDVFLAVVLYQFLKDLYVLEGHDFVEDFDKVSNQASLGCGYLLKNLGNHKFHGNFVHVQHCEFAACNELPAKKMQGVDKLLGVDALEVSSELRGDRITLVFSCVLLLVLLVDVGQDQQLEGLENS